MWLSGSVHRWIAPTRSALPRGHHEPGHPLVHEVRAGFGLLAAVELEADVLAEVPDAPNKLLAGAREAGVLVRGLGKGVARSPPLTVTLEELGLLAEGIRAGLDALGSMRPEPALPGSP